MKTLIAITAAALMALGSTVPAQAATGPVKMTRDIYRCCAA